MRVQIQHASPHQNGKVLGVLMAITSLVLVVPMFALLQFAPVPTDFEGNPAPIPRSFILMFPVMYLILGYVGGAVASVVYNLIVKVTGGFQFELKDLV